MSEFIHDVGVSEFTSQVVERSHSVPVVVDFWAEWCGPCRTLGPMLEQAADSRAGAFELAKVDVDQNPGLASQFSVQGIPTVLGFRDGKAVSRFVGAVPKERLDGWLDDLIPTESDRAVEAARDLLLGGDTEAAEDAYRAVLEADPRHVEAAVGLASLLIGSDRSDEAVAILERIPRSPEVQQLLAAARLASRPEDDVDLLKGALAADPDDVASRMRLARAQAAAADHEEALSNWLIVVRSDPELREEARLRMLDVFQVLGPDHPLTARYRRDLANALF